MNNSIAILSWIIDGIGRIHYNTFNAAATIEARTFHTRDGVGDGDGGQTAAPRETVLYQTRDGVGNSDGGQISATTEAAISQTRDGIGDAFIGHCFGNHYIACVFILINVITVPLIGDSSRFISVVQIVENSVYLYVVRPRRKDTT